MIPELETAQKVGKTSHQTLMRRLVSLHDLIASLIPKQSSVHYVDIPLHGNIGDLLIMQGTLAFLKAQGITPRIVATFFNFNPGWINGSDVVLFESPRVSWRLVGLS